MDKIFPDNLKGIIEKIPIPLWVSVGEVLSLSDQITSFPLSPQKKNDFEEKFLVRWIYSLLHVEGNTLSEDQIRMRIHGKLVLPPSQEYLGKQVDLVHSFLILKEARALGECPALFLYEESVRLYRLVEGVFTDPALLQDEQIFSSSEIQKEWRDFCALLTNQHWLVESVSLRFFLNQAKVFKHHNYLLAGLLSKHFFPSGKSASVLESALTHHYLLTKIEYQRRLDNRNEDGVIRFVEYSIQGCIDGLKQMANDVRSAQLDFVWLEHVHDYFAKDDSKTAHRQKLLVQELSKANKSVARDDVMYLSPQLAALYGKYHGRTLIRDLEELEEKGLVIREGKLYRSGKERM